MSRRNSRAAKAARRKTRAGRPVPPQRLQELARQSSCPDCNSEVVLLHRTGGDEWDWITEIRHDDGCPQLAWRERTGAGPSFALFSQDGSPVPGETAAKFMQAMHERGLVPGRVALSQDGRVPPAPGWREREEIERAVTAGREDRNELFDALAGPMTAAGYTTISETGRTVHGTVLTKWMESICPDGMTMPHCEHAEPVGMPLLLSTDDPQPMIRCPACMPGALTPADDGICHLCGRESRHFREFVVKGTGQLIVTGNACRECFADLQRGRPVQAP